MAALSVVIILFVLSYGSSADMVIDGGCFLFADSARCAEMGPGTLDPVLNVSSVTVDTLSWVPTIELLLQKFPDVKMVTCLQPAGSCSLPDFAACPCLAHPAVHEDKEDNVIRITVTALPTLEPTEASLAPVLATRGLSNITLDVFPSVSSDVRQREWAEHIGGFFAKAEEGWKSFLKVVGDTWSVALPSFGSGLVLAGGLAVFIFRCWNERRKQRLGAAKMADVELNAEVVAEEQLDLSQVGAAAAVVEPIMEPLQVGSPLLSPPMTLGPAVNAVLPLTPVPPPPPPPPMPGSILSVRAGAMPLPPVSAGATLLAGAGTSTPRPLQGSKGGSLLSLIARSPMLHLQPTNPFTTPMTPPLAVASALKTPLLLGPKPEVTPKGVFVTSATAMGALRGTATPTRAKSFRSIIRERAFQRRGGMPSSEED